MSAATTTPDRARAAAQSRRGGGQWVIDRPLIMLSVILVLLLIACEIVSPGYMSTERVGTILQFSAPLAFLAAGQTLVMLTAGIDLSVAATATAAAYIMAGQASRGTATALAIALLVGLVVGLVNGIGVGIFRVNPLIMTLGMASIVSRLPDGVRAVVRHRRAARAGLRARARGRQPARRRRSRSRCCCGCRWPR